MENKWGVQASRWGRRKRFFQRLSLSHHQVEADKLQRWTGEFGFYTHPLNTPRPQEHRQQATGEERGQEGEEMLRKE